LNSPVIVSQNALNQPPSKMGFKVGTVMTVDNALKMILVKSANDIAVALGEAVAGSEPAFIARMNREASRLGMTRTTFANPHGLPDPRQVTTARDLALLASAILNEFPEYRSLFKIHAIRHGKRTLRNYNILIDRYRGATGMKTGYIRDSGFNLVASAVSRKGGIVGAAYIPEKRVIGRRLCRGHQDAARQLSEAAKEKRQESQSPRLQDPAEWCDCRRRRRQDPQYAT
jgi:D-alanyl-D-alanine carboxypeptidase